MLRKVYPGRQIECNIKIEGANDENGKTQKEENITQDDRKPEGFC